MGQARSKFKQKGNQKNRLNRFNRIAPAVHFHECEGYAKEDKFLAMDLKIAGSDCVCSACVKFRGTTSTVDQPFEIEDFNYGFAVPKIADKSSKRINYNLVVALVETGLSKATEDQFIEALKFITYAEPKRNAVVTLSSLVAIIDFLQYENLDFVTDKQLAKDLLKKISLLFVLTWHAFDEGSSTAEGPARAFRRFLASILAIPVVAEQVIDVFTDREFWPPTVGPVTTIENMFEKNLTCFENLSLICNLTRIQETTRFLAEKTKLVELVKEKFYTICRVIQSGHKTAALLLLLVGNLCQVDDFMNCIFERNSNYFMKVTMPCVLNGYLNLSEDLQRGAWALLKNLALTNEGRNTIMDDIDIFLGPILYPIAGPETLSEEDAGSIPPQVYQLPKTKKRTEDVYIKDNILDTLYSLCRFKQHREILREKKVYEILKHYHLAEKNEMLVEKIERIVNFLIRKEGEEIDVDDILEGLAAVPISDQSNNSENNV